MKFGDDVLLEVVNILQRGLLLQTDISELLRKVDVRLDETEGKVHLTSEYLNTRDSEDANV